jgi:ribonuclease HII
LAGPVVAAAVILKTGDNFQGLNDSKKLTELARERLYDEITERAVAWAVGTASVDEIDSINILQATLLAMKRAVLALDITTHDPVVLIDGNKAPELPYMTQTIVGGDGIEPAIMAASVIAKVTRDREMLRIHQLYPEYGFDQHKGYGTVKHREAIMRLGSTECHRKSFKFRVLDLSLRDDPS